MGGFQTIGIPPPKIHELTLRGKLPYQIRFSAGLTVGSDVEVRPDLFLYRFPWASADSVGLPNLYNPNITQCNDGNPDTYNSFSTNSTTYVDAHIRLDMGRVGTYLLAWKVYLYTPATAYYARLAVLGSPDGETWTILSEENTGGLSSVTVHRGIIVYGYRFFKTQVRSSSTSYSVRSDLYELAIWRLD